jgi:hypothetical protein
MAGERPRYGLLVSALGAVVLAISVFLPWYGVSFTPHGIAFAQQLGKQVASQLGNATLQSYMASLHANLSGLAGHEFLSLSAHQALRTLNVVLLIAGGLGCVIALFALAGSTSGEANRGSLALLGALAAACVLYRMVQPPSGRRHALAVAARGRLAIAARRRRDGRRGSVAGAGRRCRLASGRRAGHLVAAVRVDPGALSELALGRGRRHRPIAVSGAAPALKRHGPALS